RALPDARPSGTAASPAAAVTAPPRATPTAAASTTAVPATAAAVRASAARWGWLAAGGIALAVVGAWAWARRARRSRGGARESITAAWPTAKADVSDTVLARHDLAG